MQFARSEILLKVSSSVRSFLSLPTLTRMSLPQKCQAQFQALNESLEGVPSVTKAMIANAYAIIAEMYLNASEGRRAGYGIVAANVGIWIAWQIPVLRPFMITHFTHHPLSGKAYTMLTSMFR
jgi:rhomboid-like protein